MRQWRGERMELLGSTHIQADTVVLEIENVHTLSQYLTNK